MEHDPRMALVADNLTKHYAGASEPAVAGLNLTIPQGEIFGLLGPNGAGKTTTLSMLSTILKPSDGAITVCGIDSLRYPMEARRLIGLVPQDIALYPELTARENLTFFGRLHGLRGNHLKTRVLETLCAVGLENKADETLATYSGGMKRRANLAAGILHGPQLLFLDEPTVGIDTQSRGLILEMLQGMKKSGTTLLYTTHYMEEAEQICDRVAIMDQGRILARGTIPQIMADHPPCDNLGALFLQLTGKSLRD
ncbi:MAG: ABC transporter ATP-binding protein [Pseudomonadota bacterium]